MNKQPILYLQTDPRWKSKPYRVQGELSAIMTAGCGPTCAAMLIETLTGKTFAPEDACKWSMERGYKALNQGTYYSYFKPQFAAFGIDCNMLNWTSTYGKPNHTNHDKALELLKQGYYLIALMNKGNWTTSGHFIVVWWADGKIRINDPASTRDSRVNGGTPAEVCGTDLNIKGRDYGRHVPRRRRRQEIRRRPGGNNHPGLLFQFEFIWVCGEKWNGYLSGRDFQQRNCKIIVQFVYYFIYKLKWTPESRHGNLCAGGDVP